MNLLITDIIGCRDNKFPIRYENFVIVPNGTCLNFQFHTARKHIDVLSHTVIDFTRCVMSQSIPTGYIPPGQPLEISSKTLPGGQDLTFESCPGAGNSTRAGNLWKFKVKHFVRVLVLSVINTGWPKNC